MAPVGRLADETGSEAHTPAPEVIGRARRYAVTDKRRSVPAMLIFSRDRTRLPPPHDHGV